MAKYVDMFGWYGGDLFRAAMFDHVFSLYLADCSV